MKYWLDLFTGTTWKEFKDAGSKVSGFRSRMRNIVSKVEPGDILLCYLTGVMHWVGALRVTGRSDDKTRIWKDVDFPVRLKVDPIVMLSPEHGFPMSLLEGKVDFYQSEKDAGKFKAFLRGSPREFKNASDGELILHLLKEAEKNPVSHHVDPRKLAKKPFFKTEQRLGKKSIETTVSVPESDNQEESKLTASVEVEAVATKHTEIQHLLLSLGAEMGFEVWVARNDRSKQWKNKLLGEMPGIVGELPTQFNDATNRTIELIDVLWIKGNSIVAAFEVESTTSIYSGLLRMSDLIALQPNLEINLFLVAPEDRRSKVEQEILRPTFKLREKPLSKVCGFISFSDLTERVEGIKKLGLASSLKPDFLQKVAEYFIEEED